MIDTGLKGRVALVTGGNHGIGAAIARALAGQGASVFVTYLRVKEPGDYEAPKEGGEAGEALYAAQHLKTADWLVDELTKAGGRAASAEVDLSDPDAPARLFDACERELGPVDVLVNNAAAWTDDSFVPAGEEHTEGVVGLWSERVTPMVSAQTIDLHLAVNSRAVALMIAEYARRHHARGATRGRIINLTTGRARGFPGEVSYGASKAALESYSRAAARELGRFGITVNVLMPGPTQTGWITPELESAITPNVPLGRVGRPEDLADGAVFLASDQAGYITGQVLAVDGGMHV